MASVADPIRELARRLPAARRAAIEEVFRWWLANIAPTHFRRDAFGRYAPYEASRKRDRDEWLRRHARDIAAYRKRGLRLDEANPLKRTGRLEAAFLRGAFVFGGSSRRLTVRWPGLPRYAAYQNRYSGFQASEALTTLSDHDHETLVVLFREWFARYAFEGNAPARSFGGTIGE